MQDILDYEEEEKEEQFSFFLRIPITIAVPLFLVGILLKIFAIPYSNISIALSVLVFFFSSIISFVYQLIKKRKTTLFDFVALLGSNIFAFGILLKMLQLPYGGILLATSSMIILVGILLLALRKK